MADSLLKVTIEVRLPIDDVRSIAAGNHPDPRTLFVIQDSVTFACRAAIEDLNVTSLASDLADTTLNDSAPTDKAANTASLDSTSNTTANTASNNASNNASKTAAGFKPAVVEDASDSDSDTASAATPSSDTASIFTFPKPDHSVREVLSRMQHEYNGLSTPVDKAKWLNSYAAQRRFDAESHQMLQNQWREWGKLIPPQWLDSSQPQVSRNPFHPDQINTQLLRPRSSKVTQTTKPAHGGEGAVKTKVAEEQHEFTDEEYEEASKLFGPFELLGSRIARDRYGQLESEPSASITVQPQVMDKFTIRLPLISTVALLKQFIGQKLPTHELFRQRLTFKGKNIGSHPGLPLIDTKWAGMADHDILTLSWYGIKDGDTVDLALGPKDDPITDHWRATHRRT